MIWAAGIFTSFWNKNRFARKALKEQILQKEKKIMNWILSTIGFLLLFYSILFYIRDCKGNVSSTMGGDMSFGVYWAIGVVLLSLGILPVIQLSRWWSIPGCLLSMVISIPVRSIITKIFCVPHKSEPTGFQKFIKKTEK